MELWQIKQKHYQDIKNLGPNDGIVQDKNGFIRKYEGVKVTKSLFEKGHSCFTFEKCRCNPKNSK